MSVFQRVLVVTAQFGDYVVGQVIRDEAEMAEVLKNHVHRVVPAMHPAPALPDPEPAPEPTPAPAPETPPMEG